MKEEEKVKRIFTSKEVCSLLVKDMGYSDKDDKDFEVDWIFMKDAKDNSIRVKIIK